MNGAGFDSSETPDSTAIDDDSKKYSRGAVKKKGLASARPFVGKDEFELDGYFYFIRTVTMPRS